MQTFMVNFRFLKIKSILLFFKSFYSKLNNATTFKKIKNCNFKFANGVWAKH